MSAIRKFDEMEDEYETQLVADDVEVVYAQPQSRLNRISKMEKLVLSMLILFFLTLSIFTIQLSNKITQSEENMTKIEIKKEEIQGQVDELEQEKNELSRAENVKEAAKKAGLEIDDSNIRNVTK